MARNRAIWHPDERVRISRTDRACAVNCKQQSARRRSPDARRCGQRNRAPLVRAGGTDRAPSVCRNRPHEPQSSVSWGSQRIAARGVPADRGCPWPTPRAGGSPPGRTAAQAPRGTPSRGHRGSAPPLDSPRRLLRRTSMLSPSRLPSSGRAGSAGARGGVCELGRVDPLRAEGTQTWS
jgi:hypothetical protein